MALLTVTFGIPGSGKSTWAAVNAGSALVLSADILRSDQALNRKVLMARMERDAFAVLRRGGDVIADICGIIPAQRGAWMGIAGWTGASTRLVVMTTPHDVALERNRSRPDAVPESFMAQYIHDHAAAATAIGRERWGEIIHV